MFRNTLVSIACLTAMTLVHGKEVPPGTLLNSGSIDGLLSDTIDGKTVKSLLTEKMEWLIRNKGLAMKLAHAKPIVVDPLWHETNKKNSGTASYDAKTRSVVGWKGGVPFTNIDSKDPAAGDKVTWNARYANLEGYAWHEPKMIALLVDLDKGVERIQHWSAKRTIMSGRIGQGAGSATIGDGTIFSKSLLYLTHPIDIKGIGLYMIRYMDPSKMDDKWVYINQFRRTKRVSGGGWMDPLGGGVDWLVEDLNVWDGLPHWYPSVKLIGKRSLLVVANAAQPPIDESKPANSSEQQPYHDIKNPPYFNTMNSFEPREVYEVEVIPSVEHPYGKRVVWIDAELYQPFYSEIYDKKGEFFKTILYERSPYVGKDGFKGYAPIQGAVIDFKRKHASVWGANWFGNEPDISDKTITLEALERYSGR